MTPAIVPAVSAQVQPAGENRQGRPGDPGSDFSRAVDGSHGAARNSDTKQEVGSESGTLKLARALAALTASKEVELASSEGDADDPLRDEPATDDPRGLSLLLALNGNAKAPRADASGSNSVNLPRLQTRMGDGSSADDSELKRIATALAGDKSGPGGWALGGTGRAQRSLPGVGVTLSSSRSGLQPDPSVAAPLLAAIASDAEWTAHVQEAAAARQSAAKLPPAQVRSLTIQLNPAELGVVTAQLRTAGDLLTVELQVETSEAHRKLSGSSDLLARALSALGFEVDRITIHQSGAPDGREPNFAETRSFASPDQNAREHHNGASRSGGGDGSGEAENAPVFHRNGSGGAAGLYI
jgi:hypothetical protein